MKNKVRAAASTRSLRFLASKEKSSRATYATKTEALSRYIENYKKSGHYRESDIAEKLEIEKSHVSRSLCSFDKLTLKSILKLESVSALNILNPSIWLTECTVSHKINTRYLKLAWEQEAADELKIEKVSLIKIPARKFKIS